MVGEKFQSIFNIILNEVIYFFFWEHASRKSLKQFSLPSPTLHTVPLLDTSKWDKGNFSIDQF